MPSAPTLLDWAGVTRLDFQAIQSVLAWARALYLSSVWPTYCQCTPGGAPAGTYDAWILSQSPSYWWKFADAPGSTSAADSADSNGAGMFNTYAFNAPKILPNAASTCVAGGAPSVNANDPTSPLNIADNATAWTLVGAIKCSVAASVQALLDNYNGNNPFIRIWTDSGGHIQLWMRDSAGTAITTSFGSNVLDGNAHLFMLSMDLVNRVAKLYTDNGHLEGTLTLSANSYHSTGAVWNFSGLTNAPHDFFSGSLQHWFFMPGVMDALWMSSAYFNSGLGGGPVYVPITPPPAPTGSPVSPPTSYSCSTIADVCAVLGKLEQKLDALPRFFPTQSSYSVAFGTAHAGLTNGGSFSTAGLVGLVVDFTTIPVDWGNTTEFPNRYLPALGSLQMEYASKFLDQQTLNYVHQVYFFPSPIFDTVHYALAPGVVATITELVRGP